MSYSALTNALASSLGAEMFTIKGDDTKRGAKGSSSGGVFINRLGQISGSGSTIVLEGGSSDWDGALSQTSIGPYYTRAQLTAVAAIKTYLASMSEAYVDDKL